MSITAEDTHLGVQNLRVLGYLVEPDWLVRYDWKAALFLWCSKGNRVQTCLSAVRHLRHAAQIKNLSLQYVWVYVDRPGCSVWIESKMCLALANDSEEEERIVPDVAEIKRLQAILRVDEPPMWYPWAG
jgi:hypothetical protein